MPLFPSREWCEEAVRLTHADPEGLQAARGWEGDLGVVVAAEPGTLERPFVVHVVPRGGRIEAVHVLDDPDDLDELAPAYLARAPYAVWKQLLQGTLDPVEALVARRLEVQGDLQPLIERLRFKGLLGRVLAQLETRFVDER